MATAHTPGRPQARRPEGRRFKTSHPPSSDPVPADIVDAYLRRIRAKLNVNTTAEMTRIAIALGL
ncbi:hypothetical protein [Streptomyces sp. NRRL S-98]|uniref:hypothetical protein n=1 Tax=Streptomyces sp. NRRL S-98 TaxID=1463922 RepID=UPI0004CAA9F4|nr:hypothetical protein [Streptomyces sp. NRRL S-98]